MNSPHDLTALTINAQKEIDRAQAHQEALRQKTARRYPWLRGISGLVVAGLVVLSMGDNRTHRYWLGVSEKQQSAEMTAALTAANMAVDRSHATTGEWPDRVPLPALAALVDLQNPGPNYRLRARTDHWLLTMTPDGDLQRTRP
ncbi:MAG: hypothetical protein IPN53_22265 [Comamonadaceae bacterium]|nr:hypothetical protein [Comamonadaceae bacterium]